MNDITTKVSLFPTINCKDSDIKDTPLLTMLARIANGKYKAEVEALREEKDEDRQKVLKNKLPCFTPSGTFSGKSASTLKEHSGYICIDIDAKDNTHLKDFATLKEQIKAIPYIMFCALSCRGKGYMCLIPIKDTTKHGQYFKTLQHAFAAMGVRIDSNCKDISRKRYVTFDPLPYINTGAQVFDVVDAEEEHKAEPQHTETTEETRAEVEALVDIIGRECIDICGDYNQWFSILASLANEFGEAGRRYAHVISEPGRTYKDADDVDKRYNEALKHKGLQYTIATFFKFANEGIKSERLARDFEHIKNDVI